jgi:hypothetical protein
MCESVVTGGFDQAVRVWSFDGQLMQSYDTAYGTTNFSQTCRLLTRTHRHQVTGLALMPDNSTIWVATSSPRLTVFDYKSGQEVWSLVCFMLLSLSNLFSRFPNICFLNQLAFTNLRQHAVRSPVSCGFLNFARYNLILLCGSPRPTLTRGSSLP